MSYYSVDNFTEWLAPEIHTIFRNLKLHQKQIVLYDYTYLFKNEYITSTPSLRSKIYNNLLTLKSKIVKAMTQRHFVSSIFIHKTFQDNDSRKYKLIVYDFSRQSEFKSFYIKANPGNPKTFKMNVYNRTYANPNDFSSNPKTTFQDYTLQAILSQIQSNYSGLYSANKPAGYSPLPMSKRAPRSSRVSSLSNAGSATTTKPKSSRRSQGRSFSQSPSPESPSLNPRSKKRSLSDTSKKRRSRG